VSDPYYRTAAWRRLRAEVLRRDPVCRTPGCGKASVAVDHIVERRRGGADHASNLRGLCLGCHTQRVRGGEPHAKGCHADGTPRDATHWWNTGKSLRAGSADRYGEPAEVSSNFSARTRR
jgi:hypothetical protein